MIRNRYQDCVEKPSLVTVGKPLLMQQKNSVSEGRALHQLGDVIPA
jgi:hypothetical protein